MRLFGETWLVLFAVLLAVSLSEKPLSKKDKKKLLKTMATWEDAPLVAKILDGTVTKNRKTLTYRYSLERDDGKICKAIFVMAKAIKGVSDIHSIQCGAAVDGAAHDEGEIARRGSPKQEVDGQESLKITKTTGDADNFDINTKSWFHKAKGFGDLGNFGLIRDLEPFQQAGQFDPASPFVPVGDFWFRRPKGFWDEEGSPYRRKDLWDELEPPVTMPKKYFDDQFYQFKKDFWDDDLLSFTKPKSFWDFSNIPLGKPKGPRGKGKLSRKKKGFWDYIGGPIRKLERFMDKGPFQMPMFGGDLDGSDSDDSKENTSIEPSMKEFLKWMD